MQTEQIISLLIDETNNNKQSMLNILIDGQALLTLGITDKDQESIECAYDYIRKLEA